MSIDQEFKVERRVQEPNMTGKPLKKGVFDEASLKQYHTREHSQAPAPVPQDANAYQDYDDKGKAPSERTVGNVDRKTVPKRGQETNTKTRRP